MYWFDEDILFCIAVYSVVILYTCIYWCVLLCINTKKYLFFGPIRNISGAYFLELVAHIAICATHSLLMVHMWYAPLKGKLCVAHIEMHHGYYFTNGVATVVHIICATHSSIWCATNKLFSTSVTCTCIALHSLFCQLHNCNLFIQHVIYLYGETLLVNCWPRSIPLHIFYRLLSTSIIYFLANKHLLPHNKFNPLFTTNQWDWQPHCKLGKSTLVVLCAGSTLLLAPKLHPR
jgi:hypothetical protein